ncbi:Rap1a/Tai family immunity protein [Afipia clevelandensis]|nr:Rap1a/Tai family immunity protein [Afipia clevelandensis]
MNRWIVSAYLLALAATPVAASDVRLESYRNPKNESLRNFNQLYLDGVKGGLMAYNAFAKSHGGQSAFCIPANLALTVEQAEEIMLRRADKTAAKGDMLVSILLLASLRETYPCDKSEPR